MYYDLESLPERPLQPVVTMGNFDGVHRGHQVILARLKEESDRVGAPTMVITFHPHPRQFLRPTEVFTPIMSLKERMRAFWELDIDHALVLPFDANMVDMTAREFIEEILWESLHIKGIYVGPDMRFGNNREGDLRFLQSMGRQLGFDVGMVDPLIVDGRRVSSSRIRRALGEGQLEVGARLLGRHHRVVGKVVEGDKRGREIGFPTANLATDGALLPPNGVYTGWAYLEDESKLPAAVNIGVRPTFKGDDTRKVEVHLIDWQGDLYGQELRVALRQRLRNEVAFKNVQQLSRQLKSDVRRARKLLGVTKPSKKSAEG